MRELDLPGKLFIVEGIDGSGKSTQLDLLHKWLVSQGYLVVVERVELVVDRQADHPAREEAAGCSRRCRSA